VFFRATDENLALIGPDEDLDEILKGKSPRAKDNNKRKDAQDFDGICSASEENQY